MDEKEILLVREGRNELIARPSLHRQALHSGKALEARGKCGTQGHQSTSVSP